jgi:lysophospholipase L1-like esterase
VKWLNKLYKTTSVILVTTALLFALLYVIFNASLGMLYGIRDHYAKVHNPVSEKYGDAIQEAYPSLTRQDLDQLLTETWGRNHPNMIDAFTQYKERPFHGRYVNIDDNGFRWSSTRPEWPPSPNNVNVFVFGGSTVFGYGVADNETIPSFLEVLLNQSEQKVQVRVYNFGRGSYYSSQERILFEKLLVAGRIPALALFIDGLNEFMSPQDEPAGTTTLNHLNDMTTSEHGTIIIHNLLVTSNIRRFGEFLKAHFLRQAPQASTPSPQAGLMNATDATRIVERYLANQKLAEATSAAYHVVPVFIWQPVPFYHYDLRYHVDGGLHTRPEVELGYSVARKVLVEELHSKNFLWFADIQQTLDNPRGLYVDSVHYSAKMNQIIAQQIYQFLIQRFATLFTNNK